MVWLLVAPAGAAPASFDELLASEGLTRAPLDGVELVAGDEYRDVDGERTPVRAGCLPAEVTPTPAGIDAALSAGVTVRVAGRDRVLAFGPSTYTTTSGACVDPDGSSDRYLVSAVLAAPLAPSSCRGLTGALAEACRSGTPLPLAYATEPLASAILDVLGSTPLGTTLGAAEIGGLLGTGVADGAGGLGSTEGLGLGGLGVRGTGIGATGGGAGGVGARVTAPDGQVTVSAPPTATGGYDPEVLATGVKRYMNQIRYCYQRELVRDPTIGGDLVVTFAILPDGTTAEVAKGSGTVADAVDACVRGRFARMVFDPPPAAKVTATYPLRFTPGPR